MSFQQLTNFQQAVVALRRNDLRRAMYLLGQAVVRNPEDTRSLALLAVLYSQNGRHDQAIRALRHVLRVQPNVPNHHFNLAVALEKAGQSDEAIRTHQACLKLEPKHERALHALHFLQTGEVASTGGTEVVDLQRARPRDGAKLPRISEEGMAPDLVRAFGSMPMPLPTRPPVEAVEDHSRKMHFFGEGEEPDEDIVWDGNIYDLDWALANYPGYSFGIDPGSGRPNRILNPKGNKVADVRPNGDVNPAEIWFRE